MKNNLKLTSETHRLSNRHPRVLVNLATRHRSLRSFSHVQRDRWVHTSAFPPRHCKFRYYQ